MKILKSTVVLIIVLFHYNVQGQTLLNRVDLRSQQTSIKFQGNRWACTTFSAIAAMEAEYQRMGYTNMDLSEEFASNMAKLFSLNPNYDYVKSLGADGKESGVAAYGGGGGVGFINILTSGMKVPKENVWPFQTSDYTAAEYPALSNAWDADYWKYSQKNVSDFNLGSGFIKKSYLTQEKYYGGNGEIKYISGPGSSNRVSGNSLTNAIERALANGKEVVADFDFTDRELDEPNGRDSRIVRPKSTRTSRGGHAMLIVGYDRSSSDASKHYFIVKNSWGANNNMNRSDGFLYVSYEFVKQRVFEAGYIKSLSRPSAWRELAFVGRWNLNFDGFEGVLDIYHLPGIRQNLWETYGDVKYEDKRIGTFYDKQGKAYKVNGSIINAGNGGRAIGLSLYFSSSTPLLPYDTFKGKKFRLYMLGNSDIIAGTFLDKHGDPNSKTWGAYAVRHNSNAFPFVKKARDNQKNSMKGEWTIKYGFNRAADIKIEIERIQGNDFYGKVRSGVSSRTRPIRGKFLSDGQGTKEIEINNVIPGTNSKIILWRLSWHSNVLSGYIKEGNGALNGGVVMTKSINERIFYGNPNTIKTGKGGK